MASDKKRKSAALAALERRAPDRLDGRAKVYKLDSPDAKGEARILPGKQPLAVSAQPQPLLPSG